MNIDFPQCQSVKPSMASEVAYEATIQKAEDEKNLNEWLPITSSRNGKCCYSAFHNVTAMVGAGVLGLPFAMSELGWGVGVTLMVLSWVVTLYTLWQMVEMHECVPGKRFDRYHELGQEAFGEKLGLWIVVPLQLTVEVGLCIIYMITGGKSIQKALVVLSEDGTGPPVKLTYYIMMFASVQFFLSHLPSFNSITGISLLAAIMSVCYSTMAWTASLQRGVKPNIEYTSRESTTTGKTFAFFSALGDVAFAFAGHNVVLEIQATMPSTTETPSKKPMRKGVIVAYIVVALCYFPVAWVGYWAFGNTVDDNILLSLERPRVLIAMANIFVFIHVIGSYQVFAMPVFDMVEYFLVIKMEFKPSKILRFMTRTLFVVFTMFIGMTFPFFGSILGLLGGLVFAPTSYYLPCIIWLILKKPKKYGLDWCTNWVNIRLYNKFQDSGMCNEGSAKTTQKVRRFAVNETKLRSVQTKLRSMQKIPFFFDSFDNAF